MKAIISTTFEDKYFWCLPITTWVWNKLGIDVICFMPQFASDSNYDTYCDWLDRSTYVHDKVSQMRCKIEYFQAPDRKVSTYAQISRLYGGSLDLPNSTFLVSSDIDMLVFTKDLFSEVLETKLTNLGYDLTPDSQLPMCYTWGTVAAWRSVFETHGKTLQECLDEQLEHEECENMKGNLWSRDQEILKNQFSKHEGLLLPRARPGTAFAKWRIDRDDSYFMDRLSPDILDYHMHRPGYEPENTEKIISVIQYFYPNDDLSWIRQYAEEYRNLMK